MTDRAFIHRPFDGHIRMKPTGVLLAKLAGDAGFVNVGDYESVTYSVEIEEEDIFSPQAPERVKIATLPTESSISLSFELSQLTDMFRAVAYASEPDLVFAQDAAANTKITVIAAKAGRIFPVGKRKISAVEVTDPAAQAGDPVYVEGTHFQFDGETGHVEIIAHPDGSDTGTVDIEFASAAIAGRKTWGLLSSTDIRGSLMFRSTNKYGPLQLTEFWDVKFRADGDQTLGSNSTDWANVSFTGEVFANSAKPLAFAYGQVTDLPRPA